MRNLFAWCGMIMISMAFNYFVITIKLKQKLDSNNKIITKLIAFACFFTATKSFKHHNVVFYENPT